MCNNNCNNCNNNCNQNDPCGCKTSTDDIVYNGPELTCVGIQTCDTLTDALSTLSEYMCSVDLVQVIINNITNNINLYNQFTTIVNNTVDCQTVYDCISTTTTTIAVGDLIVQNQTLNSNILNITVESGTFSYTNFLPVNPGNTSTGTHGITTSAIIVELDIAGSKDLELWINGVLLETLTFVTSGTSQFEAQVIYPTDNVLIKLRNH